MFQPIYRYFENIGNADHISLWKSKVLSDKSINPLTKSDNRLAPTLTYFGNMTRANFYGRAFLAKIVSLLKQ